MARIKLCSLVSVFVICMSSVALYGLVVEAEKVIAGVKFGDMKTLTYTRSTPLHMEEDVLNPDNLLFSDVYGIQIYNNSDTTVVVGGVTTGYTEGAGTIAKFNYINGFVQWNVTHMIVTDSGNNCLRFINRNSWSTSAWVGSCYYGRSGGFSDGFSARFHYPYAVVKDVRSPDKIIVTDRGNNALRQIDVFTRIVVTLFKNQLSSPAALSFDPRLENLLISSTKKISVYDTKAGAIITIMGDKNGNFADGLLSQATVVTVNQILPLNDNGILLADTGNNVLRVIDTTISSVISICTPNSEGNIDGPIDTCQLNDPTSLLLKDDILYVGQAGAIRAISLSKYQCPDDITEYLPDGEATAVVNWMQPDFRTASARFPTGTYYMTTADTYNEQDCNFTVSVKGSKKPCVEERMAYLADPLTQRGTAFFTSQSGEFNALDLPIGTYENIYSAGDSSNCTREINIYDSRITRRLDVMANYDITCSELEDSAVNTFLVSMVKNMHRDVDDICSGECMLTDEIENNLKCEDDITSITWTTDLVLPGDTIQLPEYLSTKMVPKINDTSVLNLILYTRLPNPIIHPRPTQENLVADLVLTAICPSGLRLNADNNLCI